MKVDFLSDRELNLLSQVLTEPRRPFVAIVGGAEVSARIRAIENLLGQVDTLLVGGPAAHTFLKADGYDVGKSPVEDEVLAAVRALIDRAGNRLALPVDVVVADRPAEDAFAQVVSAGNVPRNWQIVDVGPRTLELFRERLEGARTVVWDGAMGAVQFDKFAQATEAVARMVAALPDATVIVGGGDTAEVVRRTGLAQQVKCISTGSVLLEFFAG